MNNHLSLSPAIASSSLTFAAEVFAQWQSGKVVILNKAGVIVDGKKWEHLDVKHISNSNQTPLNQKCVFRFDGEICKITFDGKEVLS
jgi:hypothetical protein